jgi:hypothetical protein
MTRGGTAKASSVINVSEDIFAGYNAILRGGESGHVEFLQMGKGRDVGLLQIFTFESKISGGTAISMTSRDAFRMAEGMDFARLLSFFHTGAGFYVSQVLVVVSLLTTIYYMGAMALTGADYAVLASNYVFLVGETTIVQWFVQLGLLSVIPLITLYALEVGIFRALAKTLRMFAMLSPVFFMFEIQTKAYAFDNALTFGRQGYLATGRDFVLRHVPFDENYRAIAHSHLYLGAEVLMLLALTTLYGAFESIRVYVFFFLTGWLFGLSLLFAPFWFNPLTMEWRAMREDFGSWWAWLQREEGNADVSWKAWYKREAGNQYAQASLTTRIVRGLRISRLLLPASILVFRLKPPKSSEMLTLAVFLAAPFALIAALQLTHSATSWCPRTSEASPSKGVRGRRGTWWFLSSRPLTRLLNLVIGGGALGGILLLGTLGFYKLTPKSIVDGTLAFFFFLFWASRICNIASIYPLRAGTRAVHKFFDAGLGIVLLSIQTMFATLCPLGATLHTRMLFSAAYGDTVELVTGSRDALDRMTGGGGGGDGRGPGVKYLKLKAVGQLEFRSHKKKRGQQQGGLDGAAAAALAAGDVDAVVAAAVAAAEENTHQPENRIGVRRFRLKRVGAVTTAGGNAIVTGGGKDGTRPPAGAAGGAAAGTGLGAMVVGNFAAGAGTGASSSQQPPGHRSTAANGGGGSSGNGSNGSVGDPLAAPNHHHDNDELAATGGGVQSANMNMGGVMTMMNMGGLSSLPDADTVGQPAAGAFACDPQGADPPGIRGAVAAAGGELGFNASSSSSSSAAPRVRKTVREIMAEAESAASSSGKAKSSKSSTTPSSSSVASKSGAPVAAGAGTRRGAGGRGGGRAGGGRGRRRKDSSDADDDAGEERTDDDAKSAAGSVASTGSVSQIRARFEKASKKSKRAGGVGGSGRKAK